MTEEIEAILKRDGKIAAIKRVRELDPKADLVAAKDFVEAIEATLSPTETAEIKKAQQKGSGCAVIAVIIMGAFMIWFVYSCSSSAGTPGKSDSAGDSTVLSKNSAWDGSVYWVEQYLKKNLKDPDSYKGIEWSSVETLPDGKMMVRHKYRAKNSFGGYVVENKVFIYDQSGTVYSEKDY